MIEDEHENITVIRKRRRRSNRNGYDNGSGNGHENGHAYSPNGNGSANGKHNWGWTRPAEENPFAERAREERRSESNNGYSRRRLTFDEPEQDQAVPDAIKVPFDPWRFFVALKRRWWWLALGAMLVGGLGFYAANRVLKYKVGVNLVRRQISDPLNPNPNDPNHPQLSDQTLFGFMRSPEILRRVADQAGRHQPPIPVTVPELAKSVSLVTTANPDILTIAVAGDSRDQRLVDIANIFATEVANYTREIQASESGGVAEYLDQKLKIAEEQWRTASEDLAQFQKNNGMINPDREADALTLAISAYDTKYESAKIELNVVRLERIGLEQILSKQTPKNEKLQTAKDELANLKLKYTDEHPAVIEQKRKIELLSKASPTNNPTDLDGFSAGPQAAAQIHLTDLKNKEAGLEKQMEEYDRLRELARQKMGGMGEQAARFAAIKAKVTAADAVRQKLMEHQRNSQLMKDTAMGLYRVIEASRPTSPKDIDWKRRAMKVSAITIAGAGFGFTCAMLLAFFCEASDPRLKTSNDIERATGLKVIASLGDLNKMSKEEKSRWAFRTLTLLRGRLCRGYEDALVCGIISSRHGEGRSTWVDALAQAAGQQGLEVVPFDPDFASDVHGDNQRARNGEAKDEHAAEDSKPREPIITPPPRSEHSAKPTLDVATISPEPKAIVPVSSLVWTIEGRKQWQQALENARTKQNAVILIDLPPASSEKAILLAQQIPQLIWLVGSGMADVQETKEQLETLRHARCNIVGAVLNFAPPAALNTRFSRWFSKTHAFIAFALGLLFCGSVQAQEQKLAFSGTTQIKRAKWQERLTLGPGDAMDISLYGHPDLTRTNIFVGPDGRISYLQVQGFKADGLTIEELRTRLDQELSRYFNTARTMIIPTAFVSKKYYVLGKINSKGVYSLDRPMTVVEAVARAQGLETGLYERNTVEMADLSRSFLIREGKRLDVDFEKLFYEGDLRQNVMIEPDDFLFFGAAGASEIYVIGQVLNPGPVGYLKNATILTAITDRGGFTDRAYKGKVLVIRGSLNHPEKFVVDTKDILSAAKPDFQLQSHDIIYVAQRPWIRAEELLDDATQSFIQGFVTAFSGAKIGPFIKHPIFGE